MLQFNRRKSRAGKKAGPAFIHETGTRSSTLLNCLSTATLCLVAIFLFPSAGLYAQPATGVKVPEIALPDTSGTIQNLSKMKGKLVLVDFWASWCAPCRKANPSLVKLYARYKKKGFEIYSISIDEDSLAWKKAIIKDNMLWTQVTEKSGWEGPVATAWNIEQIPASFLVDRTGKLLVRDPATRELEQLVLKHVK